MIIIVIWEFYSLYDYFDQDICKNPRMFIDGVSRFDINQGQLGKQ